MGEFDFKSDDEVFNLLTRKVGVVINVKEINSSLGSGKKYVRVYIKPDLPDEIWAVDEIALWTRHKKMMLED
jgi:hypothetical protein